MDIDIDTTPKPVQKLWFSDGSLVIKADHRLFRISGAVLAARSPIFRDMLAFPQPPDAEAIEGCPVVTLPDSATDVSYFLEALFDSSFFEPHPTETDLEIILGILRLSDKYSVDYLKRRALVHLSSRYPMTLDEWETIADIDAADDAAAVIQICREVNALWILPAAFYAIAESDTDEIQVFLDSLATTETRNDAKLSQDDQRLFLQSSLQISVQGLSITRFLQSSNVIVGCKKNQSCTRVRLQAIAKLHEYITESASNSSKPLSLCDGAGVWKVLSDGCCQGCYDALKKAHKQARQAFWDKLPKFCSLPPWEDLKKLEAEALQA
ncbi:hypothetical protein DFH09DRAFT_1366968 [Mycena vulgaris]|nr:hypothetical protein DFH09DRAFT_1366968 [Mycena vulgaris]